jgi:large-conductance mechanosensitive channel
VSRLESAARAVWDFVVGDDWRVAAGVVIAIAITAIVAGSSVSAWWILPLATLLMLGLSVWRASRPPR